MKVNSITTEEIDDTGRVTAYSIRNFKPKPSIAVGTNVFDNEVVSNTIKDHLSQCRELDGLVTIRTSQGKFRRIFRRTKNG